MTMLTSWIPLLSLAQILVRPTTQFTLLHQIANSHVSVRCHHPLSPTYLKSTKDDFNNCAESTNKNQHDSTSPLPIPNHVAIIPDGNARWAQQNALPLSMGHAKGCRCALQTIGHLRSKGVKCVTLYIFSTENWSRGIDEINELWMLLERSILELRHELQNVNVCLLGDYEDERLPLSLRDLLKELDETHNSQEDKSRFTIGLAINYGGRQDILNAINRVVNDRGSGNDNDNIIDEETFSCLLTTKRLPPVDLVIRTGGERRLSNFLLWDIAYAELYFSDVLWPDFDETCLDETLNWFQSRDRRFGGRILKVM